MDSDKTDVTILQNEISTLRAKKDHCGRLYNDSLNDYQEHVALMKEIAEILSKGDRMTPYDVTKLNSIGTRGKSVF